MSGRFSLHPLERSSQGPLPGAVAIGPADPGEVFDVNLMLRRRPDGAPLPSPDEIGALAPRMRRQVSYEEFESSYGADPQDVEAVRRFAAEHGLNIARTSLARRTVTLAGTAAQFSTLFGINLLNFIHGGGIYRGHTGPIRIAAELRTIVTAVLGLDSRPIATPTARPSTRTWNIQQLIRSHAVATRTALEHFRPRRDAAAANYIKAVSEDAEIKEYLDQYTRWAWTAALTGISAGNLGTYFHLVLPAALKAQTALQNAQNAYRADLTQAWQEAVRVATLAGLDELDVKTAAQVATLYEFPPEADGSGQCIGIIELGGGYRREDIESYFTLLGLPMPNLSWVGVSGGTNAPGIHEPYDGEVCLDIEVSGAAAPGAKIVCYFAPLSAIGFIEAVHTAIHDRENRPSVLSMSWDLSEAFWLETPMYLDCFEEVLKEAAVLGVSVCCSAGDYGSTSEFLDGRAWVDYPASSSYAIGCGGTSLYSRGDVVYEETVWNTAKEFFQATGGGVSQVFPLPAWQELANVPQSVNPGGGHGRGVPDVGANADPATGYLVQVDGKSTVICGTSSGAPLWAALLARINQSLGVPAGYINPYLYQSVNHETAFRDIVIGGNGVYFAKKGWDACTGWGVPRGSGLRDALGAKE